MTSFFTPLTKMSIQEKMSIELGYAQFLYPVANFHVPNHQKHQKSLVL